LNIFFSNQTTEIRSSFVFRTNDLMKKANEREYNLNLWKNYLVCACCLTLSGTEKSQQFNVDTRFIYKTKILFGFKLSILFI
jgi:hypothetical protein